MYSIQLVLLQCKTRNCINPLIINIISIFQNFHKYNKYNLLLYKIKYNTKKCYTIVYAIYE